MYYLREKDIDWMTKDNMGSWLKHFSAVAVFIMVQTSNIWMATLMIILFVFFDVADGPMARLRPFWTTEDEIKRRRFDNIADVVIPSIFCLYLLHHADMSLLWYLPLLIREGLISVLALITFKHSRAVVFPNVVHKGAKLLLALAGIAVLNKWHAVPFLMIAYGAITLTLLDYYGLFKALTPKEKRFTQDLRGLYPENFAGLKGLIYGSRILPPTKNKQRLIP